jgi:hypothetical protein
MATRHQLIFVFAAALASMGATYPTTNFVVEAPTPQIAQQVGQMAEYYRKEKALQWLGREMPTWPERCPLHVKITTTGAGGATSFNFMNGQVWQVMNIEGSLDRVLSSVLPHEVTHTVFAHYFRMPVPRWADEGGSVLSEDELERSRHDSMVRQILNSGRAIPLRRLFTLRDYPREVGSLYAEGFSVSNFLVNSSDRPTFLRFVAHGMQYGWDNAAQTYYRYQSVDQLEQAWLEHLRNTKNQPPAQLARGNGLRGADQANRVVVRLTAPPAQPFDEPGRPIIRAQAPEADGNSGWNDAPRQYPVTRPGYLPDYNPNSYPQQPTNPYPPQQQVPMQQGYPAQQQAPMQQGWQAPGVQLQAPQFYPSPPAQSGWSNPR